MKFTGHERDIANPAGAGDDLDYMHARHESPVTGRFLSADRVPARQELPQSLNRYSYTMSNPLRFFDPDGLVTQLAVGGQTTDNPFGHVALIINDRAFSYGTRWVELSGDWNVSATSYLSAQSDKRETAILTLNVKPEQEAYLLRHLRRNDPYKQGEYSLLSNSCVTVVENALQDTGILPKSPNPVMGTDSGMPVYGDTGAITPSGLEKQVNDAGLVIQVAVVGKPGVSASKSFWGAAKSLFRRLFL